MARLLQAWRRSFLSSYKTLTPHSHQQFSLQPNKYLSNFVRQFSPNQISEKPQISPIESHILRILHNKIDHLYEYAPPHQPVTKFNAFTVEDNPGEQWITLRGKTAEGENIKIVATMIDGSVLIPQSEENSDSGDVRLHISLLVDISKGEECDILEFVCSAWPDNLEIQKVYIFRRNEPLHRLHMGPNLKNMNKKLQNSFYDFLRTRSVNDELSAFLHEYMINKDRMEVLQWFRKCSLFYRKRDLHDKQS